MTTLAAVSAEPRRWTPPRPAAERNYPMNCWWVAAFSSEVTRTLLGRWLCDTPVLLYRREDGTVAALEDRCPHRGLPLSRGCLKGDLVECGYHGFTFDTEGACVRVPSMGAPLAAARVRAFPVIEQWPYVWVWLGDPDALAAAPVPHALDWAADRAFSVVHGRMDVAANYMLLKENVLDLTHFGYVHASTFKITDWVNPPSFATEGDTTSYRQHFAASPLPPLFAEALGLPPGTPFTRDNYGSFVSPALQIAAVDFLDPADNALKGRFRIAHATTPIDPTHMHYFWALGRNHGRTPELMTKLEEVTRIGFAEDEAVIEAIEATRQRHPQGPDLPEVSVKMDTAGIQARRIVERWMAREL